MPTTGELAHQNIKDRYFGVNDPVANKMLRKANGSGDSKGGDDTKLKLPQHQLPPADQTITTLWVGGIDPAKDTELEVLYVSFNIHSWHSTHSLSLYIYISIYLPIFLLLMVWYVINVEIYFLIMVHVPFAGYQHVNVHSLYLQRALLLKMP
jgi:hypothetical protein